MVLENYIDGIMNFIRQKFDIGMMRRRFYDLLTKPKRPITFLFSTRPKTNINGQKSCDP